MTTHAVETYRTVLGPFTYYGTLQVDQLEGPGDAPVFVGAIVGDALERLDARLEVSKLVPCHVSGVVGASSPICARLTRLKADACCREDAEKEGVG